MLSQTYKNSSKEYFFPVFATVLILRSFGRSVLIVIYAFLDSFNTVTFFQIRPFVSKISAFN